MQAKNDSLKTILKIPMEKTVETKVSKISLKTHIKIEIAINIVLFLFVLTLGGRGQK